MMRRLILLLSMCLLLTSELVYTQPTYYFSTKTTTYNDLDTSSSIQLTGETVWDFVDFKIPIGFDFEINNVIFDSIQIFSDGVVLFWNQCTIDNQVEYGPQLMTLHGMFTDRSNKTSFDKSLSPISYSISGQPNERILKVEWKNVSWSSADYSSYLNYQVWLDETDKSIEIRVGNGNLLDPKDSHPAFDGPIVNFYYEVYCDNEDKDKILFITGDPNHPEAIDTFLAKIDDIPVLNQIPDAGMVYRFSLQPTNIQEIDEKTIVKLFPNPAGNHVGITLPDHESNASVKIFDLSGSIVKSIESFNYTGKVNISSLISGIYLVEIIISENVFVEKLVIIR